MWMHSNIEQVQPVLVNEQGNCGITKPCANSYSNLEFVTLTSRHCGDSSNGIEGNTVTATTPNLIHLISNAHLKAICTGKAIS